MWPRSNLHSRPEISGDPYYLVDVGFGTALTAPVALAAGREQKTPHETFRLVPVGNEFDLQMRFGETWTDLYRLSLQEQFPVDYEAANWFTSTHPGSLFVRNLIASRPGPRRRHTLYNDKFTIRHSDERREAQAAGCRGTRRHSHPILRYRIAGTSRSRSGCRNRRRTCRAA